jgi:hypothetical protein
MNTLHQIWLENETKFIGLFLFFFINNGLQYLPGLTSSLFQALQHGIGHIKNLYVQGVLKRITDLAQQKVLYIEQTEIEYLKSEAAAGHVSKDQLPDLLAGAKTTALKAVKNDAEMHGLWDAGVAVFQGNGPALMKFIDEAVESHVFSLPSSGLKDAMKNAPATGGTVVPLPERLVAKVDLTKKAA